MWGNLEYISNIDQLCMLASENNNVAEVLADKSKGRASVCKILAGSGYAVSEKLVRTFRNKQEAIIDKNIREAMDYIQESYNYSPTYSTPEGQVHTVPGYSNVTSISKNTRAKTIVIMPDVQAPLHDVVLVDKFIDFLGDYQPDELAQVGDFTDSTEISRWVRGKKTEYAGDLQDGFNSARDILESIREVFDGRFRVVRSNHDDRLELYIESCAPGLASLDILSIENLSGFDNYGVEFIRDEVVELAEGWVMAHGDEGSLSPVAGRTAFGLAKNKFGTSTVCGHTHRAGMTSESTGYNGKIRNTLTGLEVGHFMDLTKADYLKKKGVAANWQQAFGILEIHGSRVYPRLVTVQDGCFSVDGQLY